MADQQVKMGSSPPSTEIHKTSASQEASLESTKFPKIRGLKDFVDARERGRRENNLRPAERNMTEIRLTGTVKLHGTHVDLVVDHDGVFRVQSRNRASLTLELDNHECAKTLLPLEKEILDLRNRFTLRYEELNGLDSIDSRYPIIIAGEWVGPKVQRKVALDQLPKKFFVIIGANINNSWVPDQLYANIYNEDAGFYNVSRAGFYEEVVNLNDPEECMERICKVVREVEKECPFAKTFGISGIGEGIVWKAVHPLGADPSFWFKSKGPDHQVSHTESLVLKREKRASQRAATRAIAGNGQNNVRAPIGTASSTRPSTETKSIPQGPIKRTTGNNSSSIKGKSPKIQSKSRPTSPKVSEKKPEDGLLETAQETSATETVVSPSDEPLADTAPEVQVPSTTVEALNFLDMTIEGTSTPISSPFSSMSLSTAPTTPAPSTPTPARRPTPDWTKKVIMPDTPREKAEVFAQACVTEMRLLQGWDWMLEMRKERTDNNAAAFLNWLVEDVLSEEEMQMQRLGVRKILLKNAIMKLGEIWYSKMVG